jgi:hypothetical protein
MSKYNKSGDDNNEGEIDNVVKDEVTTLKLELHNIVDFCVLTNLSKYHADAFKMIYDNNILRSIEEWKKDMLDRQLIREEEFN